MQSPLVGRSNKFERSEEFFGWGIATHRSPHPDRFALRPPHKGEAIGVTNAHTQSRRRRYLLRGSRFGPGDPAQPWLLLHFGHVAPAGCAIIQRAHAHHLGYARPWPERLS